jgi:hypothetical protein
LNVLLGAFETNNWGKEGIPFLFHLFPSQGSMIPFKRFGLPDECAQQQFDG